MTAPAAVSASCPLSASAGGPPAPALLSASAATFARPGAYRTLKSNSASHAAQRTCLGVAMADVSTYCSDWWSVSTVNGRPPR